MTEDAETGRLGRPPWRPPGGFAPWIVALSCLALAAGGEPARELARFERAGLEAGQLWRRVTAHLVHLGWSHTLLNVAALGVVGTLFGDVLKGRDWVIGGLVAAFAIDAGLYWLAPGVDWYVGLSGVLHGLVLVGGARLASLEPKLAAVVLIGLGVKLAWEAVGGPMPWSVTLADGSVVVAAHAYGAAGAGAYLALTMVRRRLLAGR